MSYESSPLKKAIDEIVSQDTKEAHFEWKLQFKVLEDAPVDLSDPEIANTTQEKEGFFDPFCMTNLDFISNFEVDFCEHVNANVQVPLGMWLKVLSPSRHHLLVYLTRIRRVVQDGAEDWDEEPLVLVYKPIFKDGGAASDSVSSTKNISRAELDLRGIVDVDVDLMSPASEAVQAAVCGGIFRRVKASDCMQAVFADVCSQMEFESEPLVTGQFLAETPNEQIREQITINSGTMLTNLPLLLQQEHGGIYPAGINRFLEGKSWYFYPPYDTTRVQREEKTLTAYISNDLYTSGFTRTFFEDGNQLKIIVGSETKLKDLTQMKYLQMGDGSRHALASPVESGWVETKGNKAFAQRQNFNTEARIHDPQRTDSRIFMGSRRFTDNTHHEMSLLAARKGFHLSLVWSYADHQLITPGMPVRVFSEEDDQLYEIHGVVMKRQAAVQSTKRGAMMASHQCTCVLFVFCNFPEES